MIVLLSAGSGDIPPNTETHGEFGRSFPAIIRVDCDVLLAYVLRGECGHVHAGRPDVAEQETGERVTALEPTQTRGQRRKAVRPGSVALRSLLVLQRTVFASEREVVLAFDPRHTVINEPCRASRLTIAVATKTLVSSYPDSRRKRVIQRPCDLRKQVCKPDVDTTNDGENVVVTDVEGI